MKTTAPLITDEQSLVSAKYRSGHPIPTYDDGYGPLWIHRDSMGISGIVRARTWEDAYSICEDEFFPEADESVDELIREYGFRRQRIKVVRDSAAPASEHLPAGERFVRDDDYIDGKLPAGLFLRRFTLEAPDPDAWMDNELFQEAYGFRPNGPNVRDKLKHGIYAKDLNGDRLDPLTAELIDELGITLEIETQE